MQNLINKLRNKQVQIASLSLSCRLGGIACANHKILDFANGFLKIFDSKGKIEYCNLAQIRYIRLLTHRRENNHSRRFL